MEAPTPLTDDELAQIALRSESPPLDRADIDRLLETIAYYKARTLEKHRQIHFLMTP